MVLHVIIGTILVLTAPYIPYIYNTTDEVRSILEPKGKFYTQLKIDEISNLGAVKIRLRSLEAAIKASRS